MYFESFLPFLEEYGSLVRNKKEVVNIDDIYCPIVSTRSLEDLEKDSVVKYHFDKKLIKVYNVLPLNIKILVGSDLFCYYVKNSMAGKQILADVTYLDYYDVAKSIEIEEGKASFSKNGGKFVIENVVSDFFVNNASNGLEIDLGSLGVEDSISITMEDRVSIFNLFEGMEEKVEEALDVDKLLKDFKGDLGAKSSKIDHIYEWMDGYFKLPEGQDARDGKGREVVPLLIGPTGVFKSATVKELCKKYNFRLVDFRVAFTSRLDFSGLYQVVTVEGKDFSYACPMEELVVCSDGFREYCKRALEKLEETLSKGTVVVERSSDGNSLNEKEDPLRDEEVEKIKGMISKYKEYVKTPVLFFDEITRNKNKGVEGVLVQLLNQKKFDSMTMYGCKFVAATNLDLDYDVINEIYDVSDDIDQAYANRFMPLKVRPENVKDRWFEWAEGISKAKQSVKEGKKNIHEVVIKFLKVNDNYVYDRSGVIDAYENFEGDAEIEAAATPFPNYRAWENIGDYLYNRDIDTEKPKEVNLITLESLLGKKCAKDFMKFLVSNGYKKEEEDPKADDVSRFLENCFDSNLPGLLIGPSSLGKTSRVNSYVKKIEKRTGIKPEIITVNLASKDNVEVMGMPAKKALNKFVTQETESDRSFRERFRYLNSDLEGMIKKVEGEGYGLVDKLTVRSPDSGYGAILRKAIEEDRMVIIFFDECNRVTNSSIMSAIFEATSDSRIFGVDFSEHKHKVRIVAACNLGENYTGAKGIDPALAARFALYWKKQFNINDANSFIEFLKSKNEEGEIDGLVLSFLESLPRERVVDFLKSVEERELENATPSSRMLYALSRDIKSMRGNKSAKGEFEKSVFNGTLLFSEISKNELFKLGEGIRTKKDISVLVPKMRDMISGIRKSSKRWEGKLANKGTNVMGEEQSANDVLDALYELDSRIGSLVLDPNTNADVMYRMLNITQGLLEALIDIDYSISDVRQNVFEGYVGIEFTQEFLPFFNERFGTENDAEILIEHLDDVLLIEEFFSRRISGMGALTEDLKVSEMVKLVDEFWDYWKGKNIAAINCGKFLEGCFAGLGTGNSIIFMLRKMGARQDDFLSKAEELGNDFIKQVLNVYPKKIKDDDIDRLKDLASGKVAGVGVKKSKLL